MPDVTVTTSSVPACIALRCIGLHTCVATDDDVRWYMLFFYNMLETGES